MNATTILEQLIAIGTDAKNAYVKAKAGNSSIDWGTFLGSNDFLAIANKSTAFLQSLNNTELQASIAEIQQKEAALLNGANIQDLPTDKLTQYYQLLDLEHILVSQELAQASQASQFWPWLVNDALPVLVKIASTVIPLLV